MRHRMTLDFIPLFLEERDRLLKMLTGVRMTCVIQDGKITEPEIELDRDISSYGSGEQEIIRFVQTPTRPLDLTQLDRDRAIAALDLHNKFWSLKLGV